MFRNLETVTCRAPCGALHYRALHGDLHGAPKPPWRPPRSSMTLHGDLDGAPWRPKSRKITEKKGKINEENGKVGKKMDKWK